MKKAIMLELQRFKELLDAHGAKLELWPDSLRQSAHRLLKASGEATEALRQAERLHELLEQAPSIEPSQKLMSAVTALPARYPHRGFREWWPFQSVFRPALGLAMAAVLGLVTGGIILPEEGTPAETYAGAAASPSWEDLSELAFAQEYAADNWGQEP